MIGQRGKVKWFRNDKGYGFLTIDRTGSDVFVHFSGLLVTPDTTIGHKDDGTPLLGIRNDVAVEFDVEADKKGYRAVNVRVVK